MCERSVNDRPKRCFFTRSTYLRDVAITLPFGRLSENMSILKRSPPDYRLTSHYPKVGCGFGSIVQVGTQSN